MAYFYAEPYFEKDLRFYTFIGNKSIGKTYWAIHYCIEKWEKDETGFAWIFNTQDEVKDFKTELLNYLDHKKYSIVGMNVWDRKKGVIWGKLGAINTQHKLKNLQNCKTLIFDEVENGNGQLNRNTRFGKFTKIISNMERKKIGFKIFCFMNAETKDNIIFEGLKIKFKGEKMYLPDINGVIIPLSSKKYFNDNERENSIAYKMMKYDKQTFDMAFNNKFSKDDDRMITQENEIKVENYLYNVVYLKNTLTIYIDENENMIFDDDHFNGLKIIPIIPLSNLDSLENSKQPKKLLELAQKWLVKIRANKILFTKYWIKEIILQWINYTIGANYE